MNADPWMCTRLLNATSKSALDEDLGEIREPTNVRLSTDQLPRCRAEAVLGAPELGIA